MSKLVNPHGGGALKPLLLEGDALVAEKSRAESLPNVKVSSREAGDIVMMGIGGFTPLDGFMTRADWQGVCDGMKPSRGVGQREGIEVRLTSHIFPVELMGLPPFTAVVFARSLE